MEDKVPHHWSLRMSRQMAPVWLLMFGCHNLVVNLTWDGAALAQWRTQVDALGAECERAIEQTRKKRNARRTSNTTP